MRRVVERALEHGSRVLILPITRIPSTAEQRTPFTNQEVARYNDLLSGFAGDRVEYLSERDLFGRQTPEEFCAGPDTVHLNAPAHDTIAAAVCDWIGRAHPA